MERLTHERCNGIKQGYWTSATKERLVQRLAMFENIGLEPKEILELKQRNTPMEIKEIHCDEYFCPACGSENNCDQYMVYDRYCPVCGQALKESSEEEKWMQ